ncbi:hypothetical protein [Streptomyces sulfonofaciens]|nr:hypothetical protein [Streptomyces sulfonofaciens]
MPEESAGKSAAWAKALAVVVLVVLVPLVVWFLVSLQHSDAFPW